MAGFVVATAAVFLLPPSVDGGGSSSTLFNQTAQIASNQANVAFLTLGIVGLLFLAWRGTFWAADAARVARVMIGETILVHLLKLTTTPWMPRPSGGAGGFPSGHSAAAFALAFLLTERMPRLAPVWYGIAAVIAWSRAEVGAHYPYQIIGGMAVGLLAAVAFNSPPRHWRRLFRRRRRNPSFPSPPARTEIRLGDTAPGTRPQ